MANRRSETSYAAKRVELLDAVWLKLTSEALESLSLNRFLAELGLSKGAFYHYFSGWEDVLEAALEHQARGAIADLEAGLGDRQASPLEKLNGFLGLDATRPASATRLRGLLLQIYRSGDAGLLRRLLAQSDALSLPLLERIVEDGIAEGQFDTPYAAAVAENLLSEWNRTLLRLFELIDSSLAADDVRRLILQRVEGSAHITERLLTIPRGKLERIDANGVDRIVRFWRQRR